MKISARTCATVHQEQKPVEPDLEFYLVEIDRCIILKVRDKNLGASPTPFNNILQINKKSGKIRRSACVNPGLGLPLDDRRQLKFEGE